MVKISIFKEGSTLSMVSRLSKNILQIELTESGSLAKFLRDWRSVTKVIANFLQPFWVKQLTPLSVLVVLLRCLSVCPTVHSFWPRNPFFWLSAPWDLGKNRFSKFPFWPFFGHFRVFFLSIISNSFVSGTSHSDQLINLIFSTALRGHFNNFWNFAFLPLLGAH